MKKKVNNLITTSKSKFDYKEEIEVYQICHKAILKSLKSYITFTILFSWCEFQVLGEFGCCQCPEKLSCHT